MSQRRVPAQSSRTLRRHNTRRLDQRRAKHTHRPSQQLFSQRSPALNFSQISYATVSIAKAVALVIEDTHVSMVTTAGKVTRRSPRLRLLPCAGCHGSCCPLVIEDAQVSGDDLVLEDGSGRDVDPVAVVRDDDDGALRRRRGCVSEWEGWGRVGGTGFAKNVLCEDLF